MSRLCIRWMMALGFLWSAWGSPPCPGDDWPEFRGRGRAGIWRERASVALPGRDGIRFLWRAPVGPGYSGPTVAEDRVYVMDRGAEAGGDEERVLCFGAEDGRMLWEHRYACRYGSVAYALGPRASVTVAGGRAFALGTMGHLRCLNAANGAVLWRKDPGEEYDVRVPPWGIACCPLVEGDLVIVLVGGGSGGCVVAFDAGTGREAWRALDDPVGYTSPVAIAQADRRVVVVWTAQRVAGLDARTGAVCWQHPTPPHRMPINVGVPAFDESGERMFLSTFYDGARLLRVPRERLAVEELWCRRGASERETDALHAMISPPYIRGDHIYGVDSYGELRCLDLGTGARVWEDRTAVPQGRWGTAFLVRENEGARAWMFNEAGELIQGELTPGGYRELGRVPLLEPTTSLAGSSRRPAQATGPRDRRQRRVVWSHPAFACGRIYARNDRELVCARLADELDPSDESDI